MLACGSQDGNVTLLQMNDTLAHMQPNEKPRISAIFDRETSREKVLSARMREVHLAAKQERQKSAKSASGGGDEEDEKKEEEDEEVDPIKEAEEMFWSAIEQDKAKRAKAKAKKEAAKAKAEEDKA